MLKKHHSTIAFTNNDNNDNKVGSLVRIIAKEHPLYKFFIGDTIQNEHNNIDYSKLKLTLVIAHCNENMEWMKDHIFNNNLIFSNITIYTKCNNNSINIDGYYPPGSTIQELHNVGRCDHTWAYYMNQLSKEEEDANNDNHFILFFKASRYIHQKGSDYRNILDTIRIATMRGFACELGNVNRSMYHDINVLKTFSRKQHRGRRTASKYKDMGHWLDELNIQLPYPLPVCYGGNFVVKASQIYKQLSQRQNNDNNNIWKTLELNLQRGDSIEEGHFVERSWAGLLSYPLSEEEQDVFDSIPTVVGAWYSGYVGQLMVNEAFTP